MPEHVNHIYRIWNASKCEKPNGSHFKMLENHSVFGLMIILCNTKYKASKTCHKSCKYWFETNIGKWMKAIKSETNLCIHILNKKNKIDATGSWTQMINLSLYPNTFIDMHAWFIYQFWFGFIQQKKNEAIANKDIIIIILMESISNIRPNVISKCFLTKAFIF